MRWASSGMPSLFNEREHGRLERGERRLELQNHTLRATLGRLVAPHLFLFIGVAQHNQGRAVGPKPRSRLRTARNRSLVFGSR